MNKKFSRISAVLVFLTGLAMLYLFNTGLLSFDQLFVYRYSKGLLKIDPVVVFRDVNLIPMDLEVILSNKTVLIREGIIADIGDADDVTIPPGAQVIEGTGKYLLPGLVDMHVHIQDENEMLLLVANGVTTVRNMWGNTGLNLSLGLPDQLALRDSVLKGNLLGPTIYTSGPIMDGNPPSSPLMEVFRSNDEAERSVSWQREKGYDFVKVYDNLDPDTYHAILQASTGNQLQVVGHVPKKVGLDAVLISGQKTIEHLSGYIDPDEAEWLIPEHEIDAYANRTREAGVWNVPTIGLYLKNKLSPEEVESLEQRPEMRTISPGMKLIWRFFYFQMNRGHTYSGSDYPARMEKLNLQMTHLLHANGAGLLLGTDASNPYHIPGIATLEELEYLVRAGLSPYEALKAGTVDAAAALNRSDEFGRIAPGLRADLILLEANPLDDIANINRQMGVMVRGRWLSQSDLQAMLEGLAASHQPTLLERFWPLILLATAGYLYKKAGTRSK